MSKGQTEVVRSIYERWNRDPEAMAVALAERDLENEILAVDLLHPEIEMHQAALIFDTAGAFHGHEGVLQAADELFGAFGTIRWDTRNWTDHGDWLIVSVGMIAAGGQSGIETEAPVAHAWRVRNGLATDLRVFESEDAAVAALDAPGP